MKNRLRQDKSDFIDRKEETSAIVVVMGDGGLDQVVSRTW